MKILVVDEVGFVRHWCSHLFQRHGHSVTMASCGFEALQCLCRDTTIDVVLTNLTVGSMDAFQLLQMVRQLEQTTDHGPARIPDFLLMTSLRQGTDGNRGKIERLKTASKHGFADVLLKPLDVDKLLGVLHQIQDRRKAAAQAPSVPADELRATVQHIQRTTERMVSPDGTAGLAGFVSELETAVRQLRKLATVGATS